MTIHLRKAQPFDFSFLREMLYEAVFWRVTDNKPSFEESLAYPEVSKSLADWGQRDGDTGVVASLNANPVGASWYRYWTDDSYINGFVDENIPILAIGVHREYRRQGIGKRMIAWIIDAASKQGIQKISLSVSKDNYALNLYDQQGFQVYADNGDAFVMARKI